MTNPLILLASDHRGFELKAELGAWLKEKGWPVQDMGPKDVVRCDASDYAVKVAEAMRGNATAMGVLICGTGQAMAMTANRFKHCRAALCLTPEMAKLAREHNHANVLTLGADLIDQETALACLKVFLTTKELEGRYAERCEKLATLGGL